MAKRRFSHAYRNSNDLVSFQEFKPQIEALPKAIIRPVFYEDDQNPGQYIRSERFNAVTDLTDPSIEYTTVSDRYTLALHQDVMNKVLTTIQTAGIDGNARIKAFGGKCYMDMVFSNMKVDDPTGNGKPISIGYTVRNTYDASGGINLFPFAIRGICSNGMIYKMSADLKLNIINIKHMGDIISKVNDGIKTMIDNSMRIQGVFIEMIDRATHNIMEFKNNELELTLTEYTGSQLSARNVIESSNLPLTGEISQWKIYNALTAYATWNNSLTGDGYDKIQTGAEKLINSNPDVIEKLKVKAVEEFKQKEIKAEEELKNGTRTRRLRGSSSGSSGVGAQRVYAVRKEPAFKIPVPI